MVVSVQPHTPKTLPLGKEPTTHTEYGTAIRNKCRQFYKSYGATNQNYLDNGTKTCHVQDVAIYIPAPIKGLYLLPVRYKYIYPHSAYGEIFTNFKAVTRDHNVSTHSKYIIKNSTLNMIYIFQNLRLQSACAGSP
jgi:hypothetical protein